MNRAASTTNTMKTIGLTGNIATGKSTVARWFSDQGIPVVDADELARIVVAPGTVGLEAVLRRFPSTQGADGSLNREALAALIFNDSEARSALNAIMHPLIQQQGLQLLDTYRRQGTPVAIYDAALLIENNLQHRFDAVILVVCDPSVQLARLMRRNHLTAEQAKLRIRAQMPQDEKRKHADFVIDNSGTLAQTYAQCQAVLAALI
jgi:dephospho-CoA kinase